MKTIIAITLFFVSCLSQANCMTYNGVTTCTQPKTNPYLQNQNPYAQTYTNPLPAKPYKYQFSQPVDANGKAWNQMIHIEDNKVIYTGKTSQGESYTVVCGEDGCN